MAKGLASVFRGSGGGLSEKKIAERSGGNRDPNLVFFKDGEPVPLQFVGTPSDKTAFREFDQHGWRTGPRTWHFVPCIGDGCELCEDEDEDISRTSYAFVAQVWNFKEKKMMVISAGTSLAQRIVFKFKRAPEKFTRRVWDITRLATTPKSFDVEVAESRPIRLDNKEPIDLADYLAGRYEAYIKSQGSGKKRRSTLDDEDEYDDEEDEMEEEETPTRAQMMKMEWGELKRYAKSVGVTERITKRRELIDAIEEELEEE